MEEHRKRRGMIRECKECGFKAKLNEEDICKCCEDQERQVSSEPTSKESKDTCKHCKKKVRDDDEGIQCDKCTSWSHPPCENISTILLRALEKDESMLRFCKACNPHILAQLEEAEKYKDNNNEMKHELKVLREEKDKAIEKISTIMDKVGESEVEGRQYEGGEIRTKKT